MCQSIVLTIFLQFQYHKGNCRCTASKYCVQVRSVIQCKDSFVASQYFITLQTFLAELCCRVKFFLARPYLWIAWRREGQRDKSSTNVTTNTTNTRRRGSRIVVPVVKDRTYYNILDGSVPSLLLVQLWYCGVLCQHHVFCLAHNTIISPHFSSNHNRASQIFLVLQTGFCHDHLCLKMKNLPLKQCAKISKLRLRSIAVHEIVGTKWHITQQHQGR